MLVQTYPQLSSSPTPSQPVTQTLPHTPPSQHANGANSSTRIVRLRRIGNSPLGFSIRGGWEHGTGIFISEVHPGSEAQLEGLKPGDQILRVNGFIIEQAIHEEVIALIKSSSRITLKVKSVGMIPIKSNRSETLSWKLVDTSSPNHSNGNILTSPTSNGKDRSANNSSNSSAVSSLSSDSHISGNSEGSNSSGPLSNHHHHHHHHSNHHQLLNRSHHHHHSHHAGPPPPPPPCPVHSTWSTGSSSKSPSSARSSLSSSRSSEDHSSSRDKDSFTSYGLTHGDYMEARVFIRIAPGQSLGCSVVKGPSNYPGIFVQTIKEGGTAQESGLEVGDQIIAMNGSSMEPGDIEFNEAITRIKSATQMTLTVRKKSGLSLFQQQQSNHYYHQSNGSTNGNHHHNHYPKHRVKAIVHSPPTTITSTPTSKTNGTTGNGISKASPVTEEIYLSPLSTTSHHRNHNHHHHHSSESSSASSFNGPSSRFYSPSEHDYSLSEVESNGNEIMKLPLSHETTTASFNNNNNNGVTGSKILLLDGGRRVIETKPGASVNGQGHHHHLPEAASVTTAAAALIYDQVRREEERLAEEKKKLESEQKRLQCELEKLEKERKQLEHLKPQDDSKSISSSSTISGSGNPSIGSSNGSHSRMGFLDEIKKLAEKRSSENGLITDTLNKTRNLEKSITKGPKTSLISGQDDENRKRHELLMEEFRAAHSKMFGSGERKLREVIKPNGVVNGSEDKQQSVKPLNGLKTDSAKAEPAEKEVQGPVDGMTLASNGSSNGLTNGGGPATESNNIIISNNLHNTKLLKTGIVPSKSMPPPIQQTITNSNGETVTILRTTSPCKKSIPPPVPVKKATNSPIVTIQSYESNHSCKNRFLINSTDNQSKGHQSAHESSQPETVGQSQTPIKSTNLVTVDGKTIEGVVIRSEEDNTKSNELNHGGPSSKSSLINANHTDYKDSTIITTTSGPRPVSIKINLQ